MSINRARKLIVTHELTATTLDDLDHKILKILQKTGRATNEEVGAAVGLSSSAASRRIHHLESSRVILGYRAVLNDQMVGKNITVFIRVALDSQSASALTAFERAILKCESISMCHLMAGQYDYMLQVKVASIEDYERIHNSEISRLPGIARIESSFAVRNVIDTRQKMAAGPRTY